MRNTPSSPTHGLGNERLHRADADRKKINLPNLFHKLKAFIHFKYNIASWHVKTDNCVIKFAAQTIYYKNLDNEFYVNITQRKYYLT